jgi:cyclic-di-GMP-binding protein
VHYIEGGPDFYRGLFFWKRPKVGKSASPKDDCTGTYFFRSLGLSDFPTSLLIFTKNHPMPSFDIASKVDLQTLDNAINTVKKEIAGRFDFRDSHVSVELNKKDYIVSLEVDSDMKMKQLIDVLIGRAIKQGIEGSAFDFSKDAYPSGKVVKKEVSVRNGLKQDDAKKIVKMIKDSGLKVQAAIMDDIIRVTAKKIDDLQDVIAKCKTAELGIPLQFINMKS